jgi:hypothetical protein
LAVHSHPLFDVLLDWPQSKSHEGTICRKLFSTREDNDDLSCGLELAHRFPGGIFGRSFWEMGQMEALYQFTVMLLLMRNLERLDQPGEHALFCHHVYDCFPYVASVTFLFPHRRLLAHCVERVHQRSPISYQLCKIDWPLEFERTTAVFQMRASGAGPEQIRAYHKSEAVSAWSWTMHSRYAGHRPDDVLPKSLIEERWWSGGAMERAAQSANLA